MLPLFPPGDMNCEAMPMRCAWREFNFVYSLVKRFIEPHLGIEGMIGSWSTIVKMLAENPRNRNYQISQLFGDGKLD